MCTTTPARWQELAMTTFWSHSGTIRLLLSSSTYVLSPHGGTYVLRGTFVLPPRGAGPIIVSLIR